jgi:hypothetical protein
MVAGIVRGIEPKRIKTGPKRVLPPSPTFGA